MAALLPMLFFTLLQKSAAADVKRTRFYTTTDSAEVADRIRTAILANTETSTVFFEEMDTLYRWNSEIRKITEIVVSFDSKTAFPEVQSQIIGTHSYDRPMVLYELPGSQMQYVRGEFTFKTEADGESKCVTLLRDGAAAIIQYGGLLASIKTNRAQMSKVDDFLGPGVNWVSIGGNATYLEWMDAQIDGTASAAVPNKATKPAVGVREEIAEHAPEPTELMFVYAATCVTTTLILLYLVVMKSGICKKARGRSAKSRGR